MKPFTLYLTRQRWHVTDPDGLRHSGERSGEDGWQLAGLGAMLDAPAPRRRRLEVVLSSACVRFLVLPWNSAAWTGRGMSVLVHQAWQREAIDANSHDIRILWPGYGMPLISVAYPRQLGQVLAGQLSGWAGKPARIDCSVIAMTARHLKTFGPPRELLMFQEEDGYTGVHVQAGQVVNVEHLPLDGQGLDALPIWLKRKQLDYPDPATVRWLEAVVATPEDMPGPVAAAGMEEVPA